MKKKIKKYPKGGVIGDPPKKYSITKVENNIDYPLTDINFIDSIIKYGYHNDRGAVMKMTPEQRQSLVPQGSTLSWAKGVRPTANIGGYNYFDRGTVSTGTDILENGKPFIKNANPSQIKEYYGDVRQPVPQYGMGGILQGIGGMFGGIPVIGGFVEGAFNLMGKGVQGFEDAKAERLAKQQQLSAAATSAQKTGQMGLLAGAQSKYLDTFPYGGTVPGMTPVELEKQEVYQTPDGMMGQVDGPSHGEGGVDMSLPGGTFVWSDKLKTSNGRTFADEAARLGKLKAKYEKILNS